MLIFRKMLSRIVPLALAFSAWGNVAAALDFPRQTNVLGAANVFGYLNYQVDLGEIELTGEVSVPVLIDFSSDPERQPSMLGWGWRFPLLESSLYLVNEGKLRWDAINGETYYLFRGKEQGVYELPGGGVVARQGRRPDVFDVRHGSGWVFEYSGGSLRRFSVSDGTSFTMRTGHHRLVSSITDDRGRPLFEIRYHREGMPEQLIFSQTEKVNLEFSDIRWKFALSVQEDATGAPAREVEIETDTFSNLASIQYGEEEIAETYAYAQSELVNVPVSAKSPQKVAPRKLLPSELKVTRPSAPEYAFGWDGITGHLTSAGDDTYSVTPRSSPFEYSRIVRTSAEGATDSWNHDVKTGVKTVMGRDGLVKKTYYILSKGELYGKVRKEEELKDGRVVSAVSNSYDPSGRLVRSIENGDVRTWDREDSRDGSIATEFLNGTLLSETFFKNGNISKSFEYSSTSVLESRYSDFGELIYRKKEENNVVQEWKYKGGRVLEHTIDGQLAFLREYSADGELLLEVKNGYTMHVFFRDGIKHKKYEYEDGYKFIEQIR